MTIHWLRTVDEDSLEQCCRWFERVLCVFDTLWVKPVGEVLPDKRHCDNRGSHGGSRFVDQSAHVAILEVVVSDPVRALHIPPRRHDVGLHSAIKRRSCGAERLQVLLFRIQPGYFSLYRNSEANNAPTIKLALPDVSGTQNFSLSEYFKDDHGQLTYTVSVEDPNVVNATLVGSTLYVQNGLFRDGRSFVTITASDGFASVNDTLNATYSFAVVSFQFTPAVVERIDFTASLCRPGSATAAEEPGACHLAGTYWIGRLQSQPKQPKIHIVTI
jgi:hypothetical protein